MRKYCMIIAMFFGAGLFFGCMHECSCIISHDVTLGVERHIYSDTLLLDSHSECSKMSEDTTYIITQNDTLGTISAWAHRVTVCE